jgi:hypothetical protein
MGSGIDMNIFEGNSGALKASDIAKIYQRLPTHLLIYQKLKKQLSKADLL